MKTTIANIPQELPKEEIEKTIAATFYYTETATMEELKILEKKLKNLNVELFSKYKGFILFLKTILNIRGKIPPSSDIWDFYIKEMQDNKKLSYLFKLEERGIILEILSTTPVANEILEDLIKDLERKKILNSLKDIL